MNKHLLRIFSFVFTIAALLSSCSDVHSSNQKTVIDFDFNKTDLTSFHGSESQFRFLELISENSIDNQYEIVMQKIKKAPTNQELMEAYNELIGIWTAEFEYSYKQYAELLSNEQKKDYIVAQNQWFDSISNLYRITGQATEFVWQDLKRESAEAFLIELRRHTLFIKYNEYVYRITTDPSSDYSVTFNYLAEDDS